MGYNWIRPRNGKNTMKPEKPREGGFSWRRKGVLLSTKTKWEKGTHTKVIYCIYLCISRPPIFKVKNRISHHNFRRKQMKFTKTEISQNTNFFPENVLKTPWIKKSSGLIIRSEVYQDHNLRIYELFDLLEVFYDI